MDRIEDPSDAAVMLQNSLRVLAMPAQEQIDLFEPHCVACCVRVTFSGWEEQFDNSDYTKGMSKSNKMALGFVRMACEAILADPEFECNENSYVCESPRMEAVREAARKALDRFGWSSAGPIEQKYVSGTSECGERRTRLFRQRKQEKLDSRRMEPAEPRFHAATFQMHGHPLAHNRARVGEIDRWEKKHGLKLPAAVREWYEMEGNDLWERIRPRDRVLTVDELEPVQLARVSYFSKYSEKEETFISLHSKSDKDVKFIEPIEPFKYVLVYCETDVGIPSLVRIDGTDDPPVFIRPDGGDELQFASPRYSVFQFDQLADEAFASYHGTLILNAEDRLPNQSELMQLRSAFATGPMSQGGWPGWHHRFFTDNVLVACGHDYYARPAEKPFWEVRAANADALRDALRILWPMANLCRTLRIADGAAAASVLQQIAEETGLGQWPATTKDWRHLGDHYMEEARRRHDPELLQSAVECFTEAVELGETWFGIFERRAECYRELGQYGEALRDYDQLIQNDPHPRVIGERTHTLNLAGRFDDAFADMIRLINDLELRSTVEWADQLHQAGRDDLAQQLYLELKSHPKVRQEWVQPVLEQLHTRMSRWGCLPSR